MASEKLRRQETKHRSATHEILAQTINKLGQKNRSMFQTCIFLSENPPLLRIGSLYSARNCLAYTSPHAHPPMRPPSLLCSGRCWRQPPDKGETQARIPAPGFSLICCYSLSNTHVISYLSVTKSSGLELSALLLCLPTLSALALGSIQSPAPRRSMAAFGLL